MLIKLTGLPPSKVLNVALLIQTVGCAGLIIHYHLTNSINGNSAGIDNDMGVKMMNRPYDSIWCSYIQLVASLVLGISLGRAGTKIRPETRGKLLLGYLSTCMLLGLAGSILFMMDYNSTYVLCLYYGSCTSADPSVVRTGIFLILEVISIHPTVSFLLYFWSARIASASEPKLQPFANI